MDKRSALRSLRGKRAAATARYNTAMHRASFEQPGTWGERHYLSQAEDARLQQVVVDGEIRRLLEASSN